jgi:hypothetical protein
MNETTEDDYKFLPEQEAERPTKAGLFMHYVNDWWVVHPTKGLVFFNPWRTPGGQRRRRHAGLGAGQHNSDQRIQTLLAQNHYPFPVLVRQLPSAWVPADPGDYRIG